MACCAFPFIFSDLLSDNVSQELKFFETLPLENERMVSQRNISKQYFDDFISETKTGLAVGLLHGGLIGYSSAAPDISGINTDRVSVNGGYRLTITGSGFQPTVDSNADFTLTAGVPQVELRNSNSNLDTDPTMPCIGKSFNKYFY